jgi:hypothetical protein
MSPNCTTRTKQARARIRDSESARNLKWARRQHDADWASKSDTPSRGCPSHLPPGRGRRVGAAGSAESINFDPFKLRRGQAGLGRPDSECNSVPATRSDSDVSPPWVTAGPRAQVYCQLRRRQEARRSAAAAGMGGGGGGGGNMSHTWTEIGTSQQARAARGCVRVRLQKRARAARGCVRERLADACACGSRMRARARSRANHRTTRIRSGVRGDERDGWRDGRTDERTDGPIISREHSQPSTERSLPACFTRGQPLGLAAKCRPSVLKAAQGKNFPACGRVCARARSETGRLGRARNRAGSAGAAGLACAAPPGPALEAAPLSSSESSPPAAHGARAPAHEIVRNRPRRVVGAVGAGTGSRKGRGGWGLTSSTAWRPPPTPLTSSTAWRPPPHPPHLQHGGGGPIPLSSS